MKSYLLKVYVRFLPSSVDISEKFKFKKFKICLSLARIWTQVFQSLPAEKQMAYHWTTALLSFLVLNFFFKQKIYIFPLSNIQ